MKGRGAAWTGEEIAKLKALLKRDVSIEQAAAELGRAEGAVLTKAHRLKLIETTRERRRWSLDEQAELRRLATAGYGVDEIAHILGRSLLQIKDRLITIRRSLGRLLEAKAGIDS